MTEEISETRRGFSARILGWMQSLAACCLAGSAVAAEIKLSDDYQVRNWQTSNGLPEDSATSIAQTRDGYLWVGTFNGLVRFDGTSFTIFDSSNTPELPSSGILNLHRDEANRLWVGTLRGVALLDRGRWTTLTNAPASESQYIRTFSDQAGVVAMTTFDGHVRWSDGKRLVDLPDPPGEPGRGNFGHVDGQGTVWVGQQGFFGYWSGNRWIRSGLESSITNGFGGIGSGRDKSMIVVRDREILWLQSGRLIRRLAVPNLSGGCWQLYEDSDSRVWIGTEANGLYVVDVQGAVRHFTEKNGLVHNSIRSVAGDSEGDIWLGTSGEGMVELRPRRFRRIDMSPLAPARKINAMIEEGPGRMLLGSYGAGVAVAVDQVLRPPDSQSEPLNFPLVQALLRDRYGNRWTAHFNDGTWIVRTNGTTELLDPSRTGGRQVAALFSDSKGRVWMGGSDTVAVQEAGKFRVFHQPGVTLGNLSCFAEHPKTGQLWAGGSEGLYRLEGAEWREQLDESGARLHDTMALQFESDGTLWIGGGVVPVRRWRNGTMTHVGLTNGLPVGKVFGFVDDGLGYWWLPSNHGIGRVAKADLEAVADGNRPRLQGQVFLVSDGLPSVECVAGVQSAALRDSSGMLWFATLKGLATINPRYLRLDVNPPNVFIDRIRIEDSVGRMKFTTVSNAEPVLVPPGQHEVAAYISIPGLRAPEKVMAAYRLDGRDDAWKDLGGSRSVFFYPPGPGTYRLRFKAANSDGVWSPMESAVTFVIQPFFWQTLGFRATVMAGLFGLAGAGAALVTRQRMRMRVRELEQRAVLERERNRLGGILELTPDLVAFANAEGQLEFLNAAGRRMLGIGPSDPLQALRIASILNAESARRVSAEGLPALRRKGDWVEDLTLRRTDGSEIPVGLMLTAPRVPDGLQWICLIARDISERKKADDSLKQSESKFSQLFQLCPVPIVVIKLETGGILELNAAMENLTGCRREEVVGKSSVELGFWRDEEDRRAAVAAFTHPAAVAIASAQGATRIEPEVRWVNRHGEDVVACYQVDRVEMGGVPCALAVFTDITGRKRMENALKSSEALLREFVESVPAAVAMLDRNLRFLQTSQRWRSDYRLEHVDLVGRPSSEVFPSMPERWKQAHVAALEGRVERSDEEPFLRADGTEGWLQWEVRPWRFPNGEIGGVIMFTQWITERNETLKRVRLQLAELQRWHQLTIEREQRVIQLKDEVNTMCRRLSEPPRYPGPGALPHPLRPTSP